MAYKNKTFIAIIPARGGSKRLPRKNVLNLGGKPLIAWSIETTLKSKYIDEVMVTTDDDEIAEVSREYGARVPFKRPAELANDTAIRSSIIRHTIEYYENELGKKFDYLVFIQPTSPLREEEHIDDGIEYLVDRNADSMVSVCEVEHPVQWCGVLPEDNDMSNFITAEAAKLRSQDLQVHYRLNGALFICDTSKFLEEDCVFLKKNTYAYIMDQDVSPDVDTEIDFLLAETLLKKKGRF